MCDAGKLYHGVSKLLEKRKKQVNRLQLEREALERLLRRETGWSDEELSYELRRELEQKGPGT